MATHDYSLANQSGASFRTDLNNALAAIQSNNSNASSPATTVAYQWWADTNAGVLKIRNSSNNAWIELFQLDGTLTLEDGSASAPALAFRDDLDTGVFSSAANTFDIATGGGVRATFTNSATTLTGDLSIPDTIVHTGDTNTKIRFPANDAISFETGGAERARFNSGGVLFGTDTQRAGFFNTSSQFSPHFQIEGAGDSDDAGRSNSIIYNSTTNAGPILIFGKTMGSSVGSTTAVTNGAQLGMISFQGLIGSEFTMGASISALVNGSIGDDDLPTDLLFATTSDGGSSASDKMRLMASGRLAIGASSPESFLNIVGNDTALGGVGNSTTACGAKITLSDTSGRKAAFFAPNTSNAGIGTITNHVLTFLVSNTEKARMMSTNQSDPAFLVGTSTNSLGTSSFGIAAFYDGHFRASRDVTGSNAVAYFGGTEGNANVMGDGDLQNTNNNYGPISSDERLKENIADVTSQWEDVKNIVLKKFTYKNSKTGTVQIGPIAQELQKVCPNLIKTKKATKEDIEDSGGLIKEGDDVLTYKASIMLLKGFKALQEAMAKIETLETKVAALEAA